MLTSYTVTIFCSHLFIICLWYINTNTITSKVMVYGVVGGTFWGRAHDRQILVGGGLWGRLFFAKNPYILFA